MELLPWGRGAPRSGEGYENKRHASTSLPKGITPAPGEKSIRTARALKRVYEFQELKTKQAKPPNGTAPLRQGSSAKRWGVWKHAACFYPSAQRASPLEQTSTDRQQVISFVKLCFHLHTLFYLYFRKLRPTPWLPKTKTFFFQYHLKLSSPPKES